MKVEEKLRQTKYNQKLEQNIINKIKLLTFATIPGIARNGYVGLMKALKIDTT